ncbi:MAG: hypothetical protein CMP08_05500 [Xanthomonadales bacterium]|nr:hypothetical protein [Xanthomonadales bacterium]
MRLIPRTTSVLFIGMAGLTGTAMAETDTEALEERVKRLERIIQAAGLTLPEDGNRQAVSKARQRSGVDKPTVAAETERPAERQVLTQAQLADFSPEPVARELLSDETDLAGAEDDDPLQFSIGEHTTADIGGYVKVNANFSNFSTGDSTDRQRELYTPSRVNVGQGPGSEATDFSARWTRINLLTNTRLGGHEIEGYVEFDFFGDDANEATTGSYGMRLRDAIFELDKTWLFGQTDSTFMDTSATPETLDQIGPAESISLIRQTQIRYTKNNFAIALENPSVTEEFFDRDTGVGTTATLQEESWPDLVADYRIEHRLGHVGFGGIVRRVSNEGIDNPVTGERFDEDAAVGYGFRLSGRLKVGDNGDDLRFFSTYGDGLGRYVALGLIPAGTIDAEGNVETISYASGYLAYQHVWSPKWRSNVVLGTLQVDNNGRTDFGPRDAATKSASSFHVNLIWNPITPLSFGGEYIYAEREVESGTEGNLDRLQFSAKYAF